MRVWVPPSTLKTFPSQQATNVSQPGAEEGKTVNLAIISQWRGGEDSLYPALLGTEQDSEEHGRMHPRSSGCTRTGWRGLLRHDHENDNRDGLASAPLGGVGTGTHGMARHSMMQSHDPPWSCWRWVPTRATKKERIPLES